MADANSTTSKQSRLFDVTSAKYTICDSATPDQLLEDVGLWTGNVKEMARHWACDLSEAPSDDISSQSIAPRLWAMFSLLDAATNALNEANRKLREVRHE